TQDSVGPERGQRPRRSASNPLPHPPRVSTPQHAGWIEETWTTHWEPSQVRLARVGARPEAEPRVRRDDGNRVVLCQRDTTVQGGEGSGAARRAEGRGWRKTEGACQCAMHPVACRASTVRRTPSSKVTIGCHPSRVLASSLLNRSRFHSAAALYGVSTGGNIP